MTESEVRNLIVSTFMNEFDGDFPIAVDNKKFTQPNPPVNWQRIAVQFNTGFQESLGIKTNRKFSGLGLVTMQVFTPINKGTDENDSLARASKILFDGEHIQQLRFFNGRIETIGPDKEWYQQNAVVEFEFEDIR